MLDRNFNGAEAFAMELCSRSPDFREGLNAERRSPAFTGR